MWWGGKCGGGLRWLKVPSQSEAGREEREVSGLRPPPPLAGCRPDIHDESDDTLHATPFCLAARQEADCTSNPPHPPTHKHSHLQPDCRLLHGLGVHVSQLRNQRPHTAGQQ